MLKCCGNSGRDSWLAASDLQSNITNGASNKKYLLPKSCCDGNILTESLCEMPLDIDYSFSTGCKDKMKETIEENVSWLVSSVVTIAILEIHGIIFSCLLIKRIRQRVGYEPQFDN